MESIETLIPDNEGNHLVVVLSFYDDGEKSGTKKEHDYAEGRDWGRGR